MHPSTGTCAVFLVSALAVLGAAAVAARLASVAPQALTDRSTG